MPLRAHHVQTPPSVRARRAEVPELIDALIIAMMAKDPPARPSAESVYEALLPYVTGTADHGRTGIRRARSVVRSCASRMPRAFPRKRRRGGLPRSRAADRGRSVPAPRHGEVELYVIRPMFAAIFGETSTMIRNIDRQIARLTR
jgi:hypothetical protein